MDLNSYLSDKAKIEQLEKDLEKLKSENSMLKRKHTILLNCKKSRAELLSNYFMNSINKGFNCSITDKIRQGAIKYNFSEAYSRVKYYEVNKRLQKENNESK